METISGLLVLVLFVQPRITGADSQTPLVTASFSACSIRNAGLTLEQDHS